VLAGRPQSSSYVSNSLQVRDYLAKRMKCFDILIRHINLKFLLERKGQFNNRKRICSKIIDDPSRGGNKLVLHRELLYHDIFHLLFEDMAHGSSIYLPHVHRVPVPNNQLRHSSRAQCAASAPPRRAVKPLNLDFMQDTQGPILLRKKAQPAKVPRVIRAAYCSGVPKVPTNGRKIAAVDLFCGAGGKTHGFLRGGIEVVAGVDTDPTCRFPYEFNNNPAIFVEKSVDALSCREVAGWYPPGVVRVLIGCAPCQPFSTYNYRYGGANSKIRSRDKRWGLLHAFRDLVSGFLPEIVTVENVPELALLNNRVYLQFIEDLTKHGYHVNSAIVKCADYGVPQTRERLVVLASRLGPIELIPPTHKPNGYITVRETIGNLAPICAGGPPPEGDSLHRACSLSPLNTVRIRHTPPGGGWNDWPEELRLACHRRMSGKTYPSVYGRMRWDDLAPTLTTQCFGLGNGRFGHPEQDRAISLREAALLQTFPPDYQFVAPERRLTFKHVGKHIGNAVPARLGEVIAISIRQHIKVAGTSSPRRTVRNT